MTTHPLLIFDLADTRFGLDATRVLESVWLPELTPAVEAPPWIVGIFNLRGHIIPVIDLHLRLGHRPRSYISSDQVVILEIEQMPIGIIVNQVREVIELPEAAIQPPLQFEQTATASVRLVMGEARVGDDLVILLDALHLARLPEDIVFPEDIEQTSFPTYFHPEASPELHALFHARALALRESSTEETGTQLGLAVVELGGEYFGIELVAVQEFCDIVQLSPIPCCPSHILGIMNLRGNLVTLIDPHSTLNLPPSIRNSKAVVARLAEQMIGITVDEVHDVVYLQSEALQPPPPALREQYGTEIMGTAPYNDKTMTILDLPALLTHEAWIVNETV